MKATIVVPDALYRQVKARSALDGRSVRDVTIELYRRWLAEMAITPDVDRVDRPTAAAAWLERWTSMGAKTAAIATDRRTTREVLTADRRR